MRGKKGTTSVKHDVKQYVRRVLHVLKGADEVPEPYRESR